MTNIRNKGRDIIIDLDTHTCIYVSMCVPTICGELTNCYNKFERLEDPKRWKSAILDLKGLGSGCSSNNNFERAFQLLWAPVLSSIKEYNKPVPIGNHIHEITIWTI